MRLIDANALPEMEIERFDTTDAFEVKAKGAGRNHMRKIINDAPTIDAVPAVHGQFVKNETGVNRHCTACGAYLEDREYENHTDRFCYYCGARMKGENE